MFGRDTQARPSRSRWRTVTPSASTARSTCTSADDSTPDRRRNLGLRACWRRLHWPHCDAVCLPTRGV